MSTYNIGLLIRKRREELGMSQDELAKKLGYKSRSSIYKIEIGENDIPHSKIESFATALRVSHGYLMGWEGGSQNSFFQDVPIDTETGTFVPDEERSFFDSMFKLKITQRNNSVVRCYLTEEQKNILISMIKSWNVERFEMEEF